MHRTWHSTLPLIGLCEWVQWLWNAGALRTDLDVGGDQICRVNAGLASDAGAARTQAGVSRRGPQVRVSSFFVFDTRANHITTLGAPVYCCNLAGCR